MATVRQTTTTTRTTTSGGGGGGGGCHCVWNWSFVFAIMDFIVGVLVTISSVLLIIQPLFRNFVVGLVGLCFGAGILSSTTMTCSSIYNLCFTRFGFYWTWSGRGIFYIVAGSIVAGDPSTNVFGFIAFVLCCTMGFTYILLECCACCADSLPKSPTPLCGLVEPTGGQAQQRAPAPQQQQNVKTGTQNPFGAPKENDDSIC
jgi:hypothetical protein